MRFFVQQYIKTLYMLYIFYAILYNYTVGQKQKFRGGGKE